MSAAASDNQTKSSAEKTPDWRQRFDNLFLGRYAGDASLVRTQVRLFFLILLGLLLALTLAGAVPLLTSPRWFVRASIVAMAAFFIVLIALLRGGHRKAVTYLFILGLAFFEISQHWLESTMAYDLSRVSRLVVLSFLQLMLVAAITERTWFLTLTFLLHATGIAVEVFVLFAAFPQAVTADLVQAGVSNLVNLSMAFGIMSLFQWSYCRALRRVEEINDGLEKRVREQTADLEESRRQLNRVDQLSVLGRLAATVAHEINTPLGAILSSNSVIRSSLPEVLSQGMTVIRKISADDEGVFNELIDRCSGQLGNRTGLELRRLRNQCLQQLEDWGIPEARTLSEWLVDAGIFDLEEAWKPFLSGPLAVDTCRFLGELTTLLRAAVIVDAGTSKAAEFVLALKKSVEDQAAELPEVPVEVGENLRSTLTLVQGRVRQGITLEVSLEPDLWVMGHPGRLMQVWNNLVIHALEALGNEGLLQVALFQDGPWVVVTITDSGPGIPAELLPRLFEGGITAESLGAGAGFGLSTARTNVLEADGEFTVDSVPGRTSYCVKLPRGRKEKTS